MLDKNINKKGLFKDNKNIKKAAEQDGFKFDFTFKVNNIINKDNIDCIYCKCKNEEIINKNKKIKEMENYINDFISFSLNYNINNIDALKDFIVNKSEFINDDLIFIDYDIFEWESVYSLKNKIEYYKEQIEDYENQLDTLNNIFNKNNINSLSELICKISKSALNDKYNNINIFLDNLIIKSKEQDNKFESLLEDHIYIDNKIKTIKNNISKLKPGTLITINGVKKIYKNKIEKVNVFKMIEEEFNEYCNKQINFARNVLGDDYKDNEIIKLLDIYNKLTKINKENKNNLSDTECELDMIVNEYKDVKLQEYEMLIKFGKSFINNNITDKSQIKNFIKNNKHIIYSYDSKDKINRFISTCKRLYYISQYIEIENIVKSKSMTQIRDINNKDFDNLLKLLDKKEN
jgi:uncharacterized protein YdcH (DUF465 family)